MTPEEVRDLSWAEIQKRLEGDRLVVYTALKRIGPRTTRALAIEMGWDPFSVRPRVTELYQLGLVRLAGHIGREGVYEAVHVEEARILHERRAEEPPEQFFLGL